MSSFEPFIPASATLRELTIVAQHGELKYPEGTACAEVLKAGASEESRAAAAEGTHFTGHADEATAGGKTIIAGFGFGFLLYGVQQVFKTWREYPTKVFGAPFDAASISIENDPALLGVGYIIGPRIASLMAGGGMLSYLVLIPAIKYFGSGLAAPIAPEAARLIKEMSVEDIQGLRAVHRGGCGRRWRNHRPRPIAAAHRERRDTSRGRHSRASSTVFSI